MLFWQNLFKACGHLLEFHSFVKENHQYLFNIQLQNIQ